MASRPFDRLAALTPPEFTVGDVLRLRRRHPCGIDTWTVVRIGADIGIRCQGCDRRVLIERRALERRLVSRVDTPAPGDDRP
jgi:hypothetical protein